PIKSTDCSVIFEPWQQTFPPQIIQVLLQLRSYSPYLSVNKIMAARDRFPTGPRPDSDSLWRDHGLPLDKPDSCIYNQGIVAYTIKARRHEVGAEHRQAMIDKVASECVAVRLRMLNRVITNIYDDALRSLDL